MKISKDVQADARRLMRRCLLPDGRVDEENVRLIAARIGAEKPRNYLALLTAFTDNVRLAIKRNTAVVQSAVPLTEGERAAITAKLQARKPGVLLNWQQDASLIGGLRVQLGDDVTDASVRARIAQIAPIF